MKAIGAHNFLDEDETPFETEDIACGESEADSAVEESERDEAEVMDEASGEEEPDAVAAGEPDTAVGELGMACDDDVPDASEIAIARPALSPGHAEQLEKSQQLVAVYKQSIEALTEFGAMPMAAVLEIEVKNCLLYTSPSPRDRG